MKIHHAAVYVKDLEAARKFYEEFFGASAGAEYHNETTGLRTYFLRFDSGAALEIMTRPDCAERTRRECGEGWAHVAFSAGSRNAVDALTARLDCAGYKILRRPRVTGDGYYESVVADGEGNPIEITE